MTRPKIICVHGRWTVWNSGTGPDFVRAIAACVRKNTTGSFKTDRPSPAMPEPLNYGDFIEELREIAERNTVSPYG